MSRKKRQITVRLAESYEPEPISLIKLGKKWAHVA